MLPRRSLFPPMIVSSVTWRRVVDAADKRRASNHNPFKIGQDCCLSTSRTLSMSKAEAVSSRIVSARPGVKITCATIQKQTFETLVLILRALVRIFYAQELAIFKLTPNTRITSEPQCLRYPIRPFGIRFPKPE